MVSEKSKMQQIEGTKERLQLFGVTFFSCSAFKEHDSNNNNHEQQQKHTEKLESTAPSSTMLQ